MIQKMTNFRRGFVFAVIGMAIVPCVWAADPFPKDVPGSADPAIIKRFTGSTLIGYKIDPWASARFPTSPAIDRIVQDKPFKNLVTIEGSLTRAVYLSPEGKSPLEIYRNYEQALNAAGFKKKFSCEVDCSDVYFALGKLGISDSLIWAKGYIPNGGGGSYNPSDALTHEDGRLLVGTLTQAGAESWLMVYVSKAVSSSTHFSQAFVQVLETKAMQTGQVTCSKPSTSSQACTKRARWLFTACILIPANRRSSRPQSSNWTRWANCSSRSHRCRSLSSGIPMDRVNWRPICNCRNCGLRPW